jgi:hypothetical protein
MSSDDILDVRPRSTGEILDDAWRLYYANAPQLLFLHGVFAVPAFSCLLLALTLPPSRGGEGLLLAILAACAVPLTGIGSGACQEWLQRRSERRSVQVRECLAAALRHGLYHAAARAATVSAFLLGTACLIMPGLALWIASATVHVLLTRSKERPLANLRELGREVKFEPVKAAIIVLSRLPLLLLAYVNVHLLVVIGVWVGDNLFGFDLALLAVVLSWTNPAYDTALVLGCWLLLAPYFETSNFLLHLDTRTRQEGLDLLFRVQRAFPLPGRQMVGILATSVLGWLATSASAQATETTLEAVQAARQGIEAITAEIQEANPYPGGGRWEPRLKGLAQRLERSGRGDARRFAWFAAPLEEFGQHTRTDALLVLSGLQRRLVLLEETLTLPRQEPPGTGRAEPPATPEEIKQHVRPRRGDDSEEATNGNRRDQGRDEAQRMEVPRDNPVEPEGQQAGNGRKGPGILAPAPAEAGLSAVVWWVLGGLLLAVLVAAAVLLFRQRRASARAKPQVQTLPLEEKAEAQPLRPHEQPASAWWREADDLARQGRHLEALRAVYLAVLSLLHRHQLIRFETTRTNGEYVEQVRLAARAPRELAEPFEHLTELFEVKWYGDRSCAAEELRMGREWGVKIEDLSAAAS